jgi:hypothetical protein
MQRKKKLNSYCEKASCKNWILMYMTHCSKYVFTMVCCKNVFRIEQNRIALFLLSQSYNKYDAHV